MCSIISGVHFASWVWSIQLTSLAHSLLWVSCSPIVIVLFLWVVKVLSYWPFCKEKVIPRIDTYPTALETVGTLIGFAGGAIICLDAQSDASVSLLGNLYAFIGAVAMCFYLGTGQVLRKWMPTFMYALPVNVIAFVFLAIASLIFEGSSFQGPPNSNIFGCFMDTRYFLLTCGLAVIPGLLGHTMINFILKHVSALVVSIVLLFEPLVGSIFGYLFNVQLVPGIYTLVGGPILLVGAGMVVIGGSVSPQKKPPVEEKATSEQEITVEI
jgi:drug/metabolite transporter (DMT)-like permease